MMNAIESGHIKFNQVSDKSKLMHQLKNSFEILTESPRIKLGVYSKTSDTNLKSQNDNKIFNDNKLLSSTNNNEDTNCKGRKHFHNHPGMLSNIDLSFQNNLSNPKEKISQLINHYVNANKIEKTYNYSPELFALYNKDKIDPTLRYSDKVRHVNVSQGNLQRIN